METYHGLGGKIKNSFVIYKSFNSEFLLGVKMLVTCGKIIEVTPIKGADFIVQAHVDCAEQGVWSGVVNKDIKEQDKVLVFFQDAVLPPSDRWAFLEKFKWRVRMSRFKGVPSECLILPFLEKEPEQSIGADLTEIYGVTKYEKSIPVSTAREAVGNFPSFIPKTDEPNFQKVREWASLLSKGDWYAAEKADGTSCTAYVDDEGKLHVCSRNLELREFTTDGKENLYWQAAKKYGLQSLPEGVALQFEIVGPGIQRNPMGLAQLEVRAFSLYDIMAKRYLPRSELDTLCKELSIPTAPKLPIEAKGYDAEELRQLAEIQYQNGKQGEGIVIRANDSSWSFKVINLNYKD